MEEEHIIRKIALVHKIVVHKFVYFNFFVYICTQVAAYEKEEQGESLAWVDALTFYTTSDSKNNTPIYNYERPASTAIAPVRTAAGKQTYGLSSRHSRKVLLGGKTCILHSSEVYTLQGVKLRDLYGLFPEK